MPIQPAARLADTIENKTFADTDAEVQDDEYVTLIAEAADVPVRQDDIIALGADFPELQPSVAIYLFQPIVAPSLVNPEALPELVCKERNFVWVDLTGYTAGART
jgi:hypothetical protein